MSDADRQRRWRRANRDRAEATRKANASLPESKQRRRARYREANPPIVRQPMLDWRSRNYGRCLFLRCKAAAKRKGLAFDLTPEFVEQLVAPMRCAATGVTLVIAPRGQRHPLLPSIDQIEPGDGYLQTNVRVVSWIFNRAKGSGTDSEVLEMALALVHQSATRSIK